MKRSEAALNRAYFICFGTPDGQIVLEDLVARYGKRNLERKVEGKIDPYATHVAVGELKPITKIQERIENGSQAK